MSNYTKVRRSYGEWIPVSEDLPDPGEDGLVLVTVSGRFGQIQFEDAVELADYYGEEGWSIAGYPEWDDPEVSAWMPLPIEYHK